MAANRVRDAVVAADHLVNLSDSMFDALGDGIDPALLDCAAAIPIDARAA